MIRSGEYHKILNVNWMVAGTDGDGRPQWLASGPNAGAHPPSNRYQLFGPQMQGAPRFVIEGEVYDNWESIPEENKIPNQPIASFRPAVNAVLFEF